MKTTLALLSGLALTLPAIALSGEIMTKAPVVEPPAEAPYEAGRGLLTLQGPTGMFINPTSATLPAGAFTAQYCFLLPDNDFDPPMGHGLLVSYGITDYLELGGVANYIDTPTIDPAAGGPLAKLRLSKNDGFIPQLTVGYYGKYGDHPLATHNGFLAAYHRIELGDGPIKSLGIHTGFRSSWYIEGAGDEQVGYFGAELQLPYRFYIVGEYQTKDGTPDNPYSFGVQWRAGGVNISAAGIQDGTFPEPGFFFGIGSQLSF